MKFDSGTIIAIVAVLFFYIRLIIIQRQKAKQIHAGVSKRSKSKKSQPGALVVHRPGALVFNGYMVGSGILLILVGAAATFLSFFGPEVRSLWWLPVTAGILLMSFGIH